jgi:hypothetical protein
MGWQLWGSGSSDDSGVKKTTGGAFESPSRSNRKQCYAARDAFFECLDKNNVLDSINTKAGRAKAASFCGQFDQEFEKNCAHSWVSQEVYYGVQFYGNKGGVTWSWLKQTHIFGNYDVEKTQPLSIAAKPDNGAVLNASKLMCSG